MKTRDEFERAVNAALSVDRTHPWYAAQERQRAVRMIFDYIDQRFNELSKEAGPGSH